MDWKLGVQGGGHDSFQMLIYGMWAQQEFSIDAGDVRVQRVFLGGPTLEPEKTLDRAMLRAGRARLIQDIELMQDLDPYGRKGNEEVFSPCDERKRMPAVQLPADVQGQLLRTGPETNLRLIAACEGGGISVQAG